MTEMEVVCSFPPVTLVSIHLCSEGKSHYTCYGCAIHLSEHQALSHTRHILCYKCMSCILILLSISINNYLK